MAKVKDFFKKYYPYFLSCGLVFFLYLFFIIVKKIYPFGENSIASYDLSAQICPFIEHLFDVMKGRSALFYTHALAGGADVFGSLAYFIVSPFSPFFFVFGEGMVAEAAVIVLCLKILALAAVGTWFSSKFFKIEKPICACLGVLYAFCGYTFVANTYINWLDILIYMPFCVWGFKKFLDTGNFWIFSAFMAACIYTSFSIACFAMLTVYPALIFYAIFNKKKDEIWSFIAYLSLAFVCAVLMALPILVPSLLAYMKAGRGANSSFFKEMFNGFTTTGINTEAYMKRWTGSLDAKATYILADGVLIVCTSVYFIRSRLKTGLSKFMFAAGILTLVPVLIDEVMVLLNMGSYMSYALRFGFLNAIYFFSGACLGLHELKFFQKEENIGACLKRKSIVPIIYCVLAGVVFVAMCVFFAGDYHIEASKLFSDENSAKAIRQFPSRFAHSLGGIFAIGIFFACVVLILGSGGILASRKKLPMRILSLFAVAIVIFQSVFYSEQLVIGNFSTQNIRFTDYQTLAQTLREEDDEFYRVRDYSNYYSSNICFEGDTNVFTAFSSMMDKDNFAAKMMFGYSGNGQNISRGNGGVIFGDCVLGYKYLFVPAGNDKKTVDSKSWYDPFMVEKDGKEEHLKIPMREGISNAIYVYENDRVFPSTFVVDSGEFRFAAENISANRSKNQLAFYHYLAGNDSVTQITGSNIQSLSKELWDKSGEMTLSKDTISVNVTVDEEGKFLMVPFVAIDGDQVTVNGKKAQLLDNDIKFLCVALEEGENIVEFTYKSPYGTYMLLCALISAIALCLIAVVLKKTTVFQKTEKVIGVTGMILATAVLAVFFLLPMRTFFVKCLMMIFGG